MKSPGRGSRLEETARRARLFPTHMKPSCTPEWRFGSIRMALDMRNRMIQYDCVGTPKRLPESLSAGWPRHWGQNVCEFAERLVSIRTMGEIAEMLEKRMSARPAGAA